MPQLSSALDCLLVSLDRPVGFIPVSSAFYLYADSWPIALTNAGGALTDMWIARERGFASSIYGTAPWMGPGTPIK